MAPADFNFYTSYTNADTDNYTPLNYHLRTTSPTSPQENTYHNTSNFSKTYSTMSQIPDTLTTDTQLRSPSSHTTFIGYHFLTNPHSNNSTG